MTKKLSLSGIHQLPNHFIDVSIYTNKLKGASQKFYGIIKIAFSIKLKLSQFKQFKKSKELLKMILVLTVRKTGSQFFIDRQIEQKARKQQPIITATKKNTERHKIKR